MKQSVTLNSVNYAFKTIKSAIEHQRYDYCENFIKSIRLDDDKILLENILVETANNGCVLTTGYLLAKYSIDLNRNVFLGMTLLHTAAKHGQNHFIQFLVTTYKLDPKRKSVNGSTALHCAAIGGQHHTIDFLVNLFKFEISETTNDGYNVIHYAVEFGHIDTINYLLTKYSLSITDKTNEGKTALQLATESNRQDVVENLLKWQNSDKDSQHSHPCELKGSPENVVDPFDENKKKSESNAKQQLYSAIANCHKNEIDSLIAKLKLGPPQKNAAGESLLFVAAHYGNNNAIDYLVKAWKFNPHEKSKDGSSLIHRASLSGQTQTIQYLFENYDLKLSERNNQGLTAFHQAVIENQINVVLFFIKNYPACCFEKTLNQQTAMHWAAYYKHQRLIEILQGIGLSLTEKDSNGHTPLALINGFEERIVFLQNHNANSGIEVPNSTFELELAQDYFNLFDAASKGDNKAIARLLDAQRLSAHYKNDIGETMLHIAARNGKIECIQYLVDYHHLNVSEKNNLGETALHVAIESNHLPTIDTLIKTYQLNPKESCSKGMNLLFRAIIKGHISVVKYLLEKSYFDPKEKLSNWPFLFQAAMYGRKEIIDYGVKELKLDPFERGNSGFSLLHAAVLCDTPHIFDDIIKNYRLSPIVLSIHSLTPLHLAASTGKAVILEHLIKKYLLSPFDKTDKGKTPLACAQEKGHLVIVKKLQELIKSYPKFLRESQQIVRESILRADLDWISYYLKISENYLNAIRNVLLIATECGQIKVLNYLIMEHRVKENDLAWNTLLHIAAKAGQNEIIDYLFEKHYLRNFNFEAENGLNVLFSAIANDQSGTVEFLIKKYGFDPTQKNSNGLTGLHIAAQYGRMQTANLLISKYGLNVIEKSNNGQTPIDLAIQNNHYEMSTKLKKYKEITATRKDLPQAIQPKIEHPSSIDQTTVYRLLLEAARKGNNSEIDNLIQSHNVDPNVQDAEGNGMLHFAAKNQQDMTIKHLIEHYAINLYAKNQLGLTPLYLAIAYGNISSITILLKANNSGYYDYLAYRLAVTKGDIEVVKYLINHHLLDPKLKDQYGRSTLFYAAHSGQNSIIEYLVKTCRMDPNEYDNYGYSLLHAAVLGKHLSVFNFLVRTFNLNPRIKSYDGLTVLHLAALNGNTDILKNLIGTFLLSPFDKTREGKTPQDLARESGYVQTSAELESLKTIYLDGFKLRTASLKEAVQNGNVDMVRYHLSTTFSFNESSIFDALSAAVEHGKTRIVDLLVKDFNLKITPDDTPYYMLLHDAAGAGQIKMISFLYSQYGFKNFDREDSNGLTVLFYAIAQNQIQTVSYLIKEYSLNPALKNSKGLTGLHIAALYNRITIAQNLIEQYSLSLNEKTNNGKMPIDLAMENGCHEVVALLKKYQPQRGVNKNLSTSIQYELLHGLVAKGDFKSAEQLILTYKLNPFHKNNRNETLLHTAAVNGQNQIILYLIEKYGLNPEERVNGLTLLHLAASNGHTHTIHFLIETFHCDPYVKSSQGASLLDIASYYNRRNTVKYLMDKYYSSSAAQISHHKAEDGTPNHSLKRNSASKFEQSKKRRMKEVNPVRPGQIQPELKAPNRKKRVKLHSKSTSKNSEKEKIDPKSDVQTVNGPEKTTQNILPLIQIHIQQESQTSSIEINQQGIQANHIPHSLKRKSVAKLEQTKKRRKKEAKLVGQSQFQIELKAQNAKIPDTVHFSTRKSDSQTANSQEKIIPHSLPSIEMEIHQENPSSISSDTQKELSKKTGKNKDRTEKEDIPKRKDKESITLNKLFHEVKKGRVNRFKNLVKLYQGNLAEVCYKDFTLIQAAAMAGQDNMIIHLVKKYGLDPTVENTEGFTALHFAIIHNQITTIDFLINTYNIDIMGQNSKGLTALQIAVLHNRTFVIKHFVEHYPLNPTESTKYGKSALEIAQEKGYSEIEEQLSNYTVLSKQTSSNLPITTSLDKLQKKNHSNASTTSAKLPKISSLTSTKLPRMSSINNRNTISPSYELNFIDISFTAETFDEQCSGDPLKDVCDQLLDENEKAELLEYIVNSPFIEEDGDQSSASNTSLPIVENFDQPSLLNPFQEIFDELTEKERQSIVECIASFPEIIPPRAGISPKYFDKERLGRLPVRKGSGELPVYSHECKFVPLIQHQINPPLRQVFPFDEKFFKADYYTTRSLPDPSEKVVFIRGGRKENALIPECDKVRCVNILTLDEYTSMQSQIPSDVDIVVVKRIKSATHGRWYNLAGLPARRIVPFMIGYHLNNFAILDDNMSSVKFNPLMNGSQDFDAVYDLLEKHLGDLLTVYVSTYSNEKIRAGELGSKFCLINMKKLRTYIPNMEDLFILFPLAPESHHWGGDYYQQLMCFEMSQPYSQGYSIVDKSIISLTRSQKVQNSFMKTGARARTFQELNFSDFDDLLPLYFTWIKNARNRLNQIIHDNLEQLLQKEKAHKRANLPRLHAKANNITVSNVPLPDIQLEAEDDFIERFIQAVAEIEFEMNYLRPYQIEAIKQLIHIGSRACLNLTTGSGKSLIEYLVSVITYRISNKNVLIVTPHIDLVNQLFDSFIALNKKCMAKNINLQVPEEAIIKVCSRGESVSLKSLLKNNKIKKQKTIMVICEESFKTLQKEDSNFLDLHVSTIILDEYHAYAARAKELSESVSHKIMIIAMTATPPLINPFPVLFKYTRAQAVQDRYLAPVIADKLGMDFSKENVNRLITLLPHIIQNQRHPSYPQADFLMESKGIVYLPSIENCDFAVTLLKKHHIKCYAIHSDNKNRYVELEDFKKSKEPCVLVASHMLGFGFDCVDLGWVIFGRNAKKNKHIQVMNAEQIFGRVMRLYAKKIGYLLGFNDVIENVFYRFLKKQQITFPVEPDYLADQKGYLFDEGNNVSVTDLTQEEKKVDITIEPSNLFIMGFKTANMQSVSVLRQKVEDTQSNSKVKRLN